MFKRFDSERLMIFSKCQLLNLFSVANLVKSALLPNWSVSLFITAPQFLTETNHSALWEIVCACGRELVPSLPVQSTLCCKLWSKLSFVHKHFACATNFNCAHKRRNFSGSNVSVIPQAHRFFFWSLLESKRLMVYVWFLDGNAQNVTCFLSEIVTHHTMCFADSQNNNLSAGSEFYTWIFVCNHKPNLEKLVSQYISVWWLNHSVQIRTEMPYLVITICVFHDLIIVVVNEPSASGFPIWDLC